MFLERADTAAGFAGNPARAALGQNLFGKGDGTLVQVAVDDLIDNAVVPRLGRADGLAHHHHFQRVVQAGDTRQALGARRAGEDTQLHLRRTHARRRHRHTKMAGKRQLQPPAQRRAVDSGDDGFLDGVEVIDYGEQMWFARRHLEFADIRARREGPARTDQYNRLNGPVGNGLIDPGDDPLTNCEA